jgi:N-6 DNA Methylase
LKSRDKFRILKRTVESALKCLVDHRVTAGAQPSGGAHPTASGHPSGKDFPQTASFPDAEFTTCILLIALKVLAARKQLDRLGSQFLTLNSANAFELVSVLYAATNKVCAPDIRIDTTPRKNDGIAHALKQLDLNSPEVWTDDFTIGYAYQFLSMAGRKNAQANIQTANKEHSQIDLIAFTQLYTPGWVVDFLLSNCVIPQLSNAAEIMDTASYDSWMLANEFKGALTPKEVTILDPACGAGNFLLRAYDLMIAIYQREGNSSERSVELAQEHNVHGADIDHAALWITCLTLLIKSFQHSTKAPTGQFQISFATSGKSDSLLGSLDRRLKEPHIMSRQYAVVLMNPPYIGRKLMSRQLKSALKEKYPNSHSDICAAFIERSLEMLKDGGRLGTITQSSILTLPSYGALRKKILNDFRLVACADAGSGVFPLQSGDKVSSALILIENNQPTTEDKSNFFNLRTIKDKADALHAQSTLVRTKQSGKYFSHNQSIFLQEHQHAIKYGCPGLILQLARSVLALADIADIRQGLATSNNERFVKPFDEVDPALIGSVWMPYAKGAGGDRWYSPIVHVVNWENNGQEIKEAVSAAYPYLKGNTKWVVKNEQYYFRDGLCFSFVNLGNLAVRRLPAGCIFDVGASAVFVNNKTDEDFLLAYLNSSLIAAIATSINPTINFQVGDIKRLPMFPFDQEQKDQLSAMARKCYDIAKELHSFKTKRLVHVGAPATDPSIQVTGLRATLIQAERNVDDLVLNSFRTNFALSNAQWNVISEWLSDCRMHQATSKVR